MLFPFHAGLSEGTLAVESLLRDFRAAGISGLEPMLYPEGAEPAWWDTLFRVAKDTGMRQACLDIGVDLVGTGEADRRAALDLVARGVEFCRKIECPIALLAGSCPGPGMSNAEGRKLLAESLARAAERAEGSGVTLTIEDFGVYPAFTCSAAHVAEVLDAAAHPDLRVTFDNGNFLYADEQPVAAYPRLRDRVLHVHIKDFTLASEPVAGALQSLAGRQWVGAPIGRGEAQVSECLSLLRADGYEGWLSLEVGCEPPLEDAVRGAAFLREAWEVH